MEDEDEEVASPRPPGVVLLATPFPYHPLECSPMEQKALRLASLRPISLLQTLQQARKAVWEELEGTSLPRFVASKAGKSSIYDWQRRRQPSQPQPPQPQAPLPNSAAGAGAGSSKGEEGIGKRRSSRSGSNGSTFTAETAGRLEMKGCGTLP